MNENVERIAVPKTLLVLMHNMLRQTLARIEALDPDPSLVTVQIVEAAERVMREAREYLD